MKKAKDKAVEAGKESLSREHCHKFDEQYNELIRQAREKNPFPADTEKKRGRKKKGNFVIHLVQFIWSEFFAHDIRLSY